MNAFECAAMYVSLDQEDKYKWYSAVNIRKDGTGSRLKASEARNSVLSSVLLNVLTDE